MSAQAFKEPDRETGAKINEGIKLHELFSRIRYIDDLDKVIESYGYREALGKDELKRLKTNLSANINNELIKEYFTSNWDVKQESALVDEDGNTYRPDRVVVKDKNAVVLEFKTGEELDKYDNQVKKYLRALKQLGYESVNGFLVYNKSGLVKKVEL
jgi:hypothetical protein